MGHITGLPAFCLPRKDQACLKEYSAARWSLSKERANKNQTKANQLLKTKILLQAGTKNTGLNKRQAGGPSSSWPPPHFPVPLEHGPGSRRWGKAVSPRGDPLQLPVTPLASAARKGKLLRVPMSLSKGFMPLQGPRRETEQSPMYFDKKLQFPAEKRHPLSLGPGFRPPFTPLLGPPCSFLPFLWMESFS